MKFKWIRLRLISVILATGSMLGDLAAAENTDTCKVFVRGIIPFQRSAQFPSQPTTEIVLQGAKPMAMKRVRLHPALDIRLRTQILGLVSNTAVPVIFETELDQDYLSQGAAFYIGRIFDIGGVTSINLLRQEFRLVAVSIPGARDQSNRSFFVLLRRIGAPSLEFVARVNGHDRDSIVPLLVGGVVSEKTVLASIRNGEFQFELPIE